MRESPMKSMKRRHSALKHNGMSHVGPLRCFATMISANPRSGRSSHSASISSMLRSTNMTTSAVCSIAPDSRKSVSKGRLPQFRLTDARDKLAVTRRGMSHSRAKSLSPRTSLSTSTVRFLQARSSSSGMMSCKESIAMSGFFFSSVSATALRIRSTVITGASSTEKSKSDSTRAASTITPQSESCIQPARRCDRLTRASTHIMRCII